MKARAVKALAFFLAFVKMAIGKWLFQFVCKSFRLVSAFHFYLFVLPRLTEPMDPKVALSRRRSAIRYAHLCVVVALWGVTSVAAAQSVVFINPGKSDEAFWVAASQSMQKAAKSLGMQLSVMYAQRSRLEPIAIAKKLAQLPSTQRPDYVIFTNDYSVAPGILRELEGAEIKAFMGFSGIQEGLRAQVGKPRERYPFWIGSLEPNAQDAGYLTAKALIRQAAKHPQFKDSQGKVQMLAIAGDRSTPSSISRNQGMQKAIAESNGKVVLRQEVYGEWSQEKAQDQAQVLLQRYPDARLVWSGNDLMAFGAMEAFKARGLQPGKDVLFSGINTSAAAFEKLRAGELAALAGGHFLLGAWSMVMLYDYHHGRDFATEGVELRKPMFELFDVSTSEKFEKRLMGQGQDLDFRSFSKSLNPKLLRYDFNLVQLLR